MNIIIDILNSDLVEEKTSEKNQESTNIEKEIRDKHKNLRLQVINIYGEIVDVLT